MSNLNTMGMVRIKMHEDVYLGELAQQSVSKSEEKHIATQKEISALKQEVSNLKAEVKYERELRVKGTEYHPTDYHSQLKRMISKVTNEKKLTDLFEIVDEAQTRLKIEK